jgi:hypothetical protein
MISLFDYLGRAAGRKLGMFVWEKAKLKNIPTGEKTVSYKKYSGKIKTYPKEFLDEVFLEIDNSTNL